MTNMCSVMYNIGTADEEIRRRLKRSGRREPVDINENGLSQRQADVALAMVRRGDHLEDILHEYGMSEEEFTCWVRDGTFREYAASLARDFAEADEVNVWKSLIALIKDGSVPAIKLYFDLRNKRSASCAVSVDSGIEALRRDIFGGD